MNYHPPDTRSIRAQARHHVRRLLAQLLLTLTLSLSLLCPLPAADLPLIWDNPNPPGQVERYLIWQKYTGSNFNLRVLLGATTNQAFTITNYNAAETNTLVVTATNRFGESVESTPLVIPPVHAPANLANRALIRTWTIPPAATLQRSFTLTGWAEHIRNLGTNPITVRVTEDAFGRQAFYRLWTNAPVLPPLPGTGGAR